VEDFGVNLGGKCKYPISYNPSSFKFKTYLIFAFTTQIDPKRLAKMTRNIEKKER